MSQNKSYAAKEGIRKDREQYWQENDFARLNYLRELGLIQRTNLDLGELNYDPTMGQFPYSTTGLGMNIMAAVYAARAGLLSKKYTVISDPIPSHGDCEYSAGFYQKLNNELNKKLECGQTKFLLLQGGHASLLIRSRDSQGKYHYFHLDSSTADGGLYTPAKDIYPTIKQIHKGKDEYQIYANRERIQVRTPGCHVFTLKYFYELAKFLTMSGTDKFIEYLSQTQKGVTPQAEAVSKLPDSEEKNVKRKGVIEKINAMYGSHNVVAIKLPSEMRYLGENSVIFNSNVEAGRFSEKLGRSITKEDKPRNTRHANDIQKTLDALEGFVKSFLSRQDGKNVTFENCIEPTREDIKKLDTLFQTQGFKNIAFEEKSSVRAFGRS